MSHKDTHLSGNLLSSLIVVLIIPLSALAQSQTQYDKGTAPQHMAGVSSLGSYVSTDLGTINLSNGALNFKIPIGAVGGRGFSVPLTLNYSSKVWSATTDTDQTRGGGQSPVAYADYDRGSSWVDYFNQIGAGWTVGAAPALNQKIVRISQITSGPQIGCYRYTLAKLTLVLPDKGEVEFRDDWFDGAPLSSDCSGYVAASRGVRWHATDGSGTIFINDADNGVANYNVSGVVITADGMRYRFNPGGQCLSITDRQGNQITISYPGGQEVDYKDQLWRVTTIKQNVPDPDNSSVTLALLVTLPGYQGQNHYYKVKAGVMNQHYRSDINPSLPVINGDYDPASWGYQWPGTPTRLFNQSYGLYSQQIDNLNVLSEVVLPDNRSLLFVYNQFGEVAEAQLPTGGKIQYDYAYAPHLPSGNSNVWETVTGGGSQLRSNVTLVDRAVTERRTYPDSVTMEGKWTYSYGPQVINSISRPCTEVQATSISGTLMSDRRSFFLDTGRYTENNITPGDHDGTFYTLWSTGVEWRTETRDAAGVTLAAGEQDWTQRTPVSWSSGYTQEQPANDNRVNESRHYLDTGSFAKTDTFYDNVNYPRANNVTEVKEYDYDQSLKRRTTNSYVTGSYQTNDSIHLLGLMQQQSVYDSTGTNEVARTVSEYDIYNSDGNHAPLQDYGTVTGHDSSYGLNKTTRGNLTAAGHWLNTNNTTIYSYLRYDILGNPVSNKDANGNVTTLSYTDDFGDGSNPGAGGSGAYGATYALPTLITSPPPQSGQAQQTARSQYDFSTGLLTGFKDRNNAITQTFYNDPFDRPTKVISALNSSGVETHAAMYYAPATVFGITLTNNDVLTAKDQATLNDATLRSWTHTDGFGRTVENSSSDPQGDDKVSTIYDALGRVSRQSNPFRPSLGETAIYTTKVYDLAGRVTSVTTPDNAVVTSSYSGNTVTVTDQTGKARKSVSDGLGRLSQVYEDPNPNGLNYLTSYNYDALDNLTTVTQGSQTRSFAYNSFKQLTSAMNPESGTITYLYDNNGNLAQKTDARPVTTYYGYDALNRNTSIGYSDGTIGTLFAYDQTANGKGRLSWAVRSNWSDFGVLTSFNYDALGRVTNQNQHYLVNGNWSQPYATNRGYDLAGHVASQTYPSGHTVNSSYDAAGRLNNFTGNLGDGGQRTYADQIAYDAGSRTTGERFGTDTPLFHSLGYNPRGQLYIVEVGTALWNWNRGLLVNHYSTNDYAQWGVAGPDDNGNVLLTAHYIPNDDQISGWSLNFQQYNYDSLNRLSSVTENSGTNSSGWSQAYKQSYSYDRYGNRTIDYNNSTSNIPRPQFNVDPNTNRLTVPNGQSGTMTYDNAGNLTTDTYSGSAVTRAYDAENRMTSETTWNNQVSGSYTYNAEGQRVRRVVNGVETWQIYGIDGELVAEYAANAAPASAQKEYGYRSGQLLITADAGGAGQGQQTQNVAWTNTVGVSASGNNLTKTAGDGWGNAGAVSTQAIAAGDGYVEITASETGSARMFGLSHGDSDQSWQDIDFALYVANDGNLYVYEAGAYHGGFGAYVSGDHLRVAVEGGSVKYRKNGTLLYTSGGTPNYPLLVDTALYSGTLTNVVISGAGGGSLNLALNKPATQSTTFVNGGVTFSANLAVDGNTDGALWDGSAATTNYGYQNWWRVDLGGSQAISSVQVWPRTDCCPEHTANFYVLVSDTPFNSTDLTTTLNQSGVSSYWVPGNTSSPSIVNVNRSGRYVRVQRNDSQYLVLAEVQVWRPASGSGGASNIQWLVSDHLGTPRIILDKTGSLANTKRHDYLPFGEELFADVGLRNGKGYDVADGIRQKFTQKERDIETGLDYSINRYYSSTQGRFTSPDPMNSSGIPLLPQTWNRYSYTINNPLLYTDPKGLIWGYHEHDGIRTFTWYGDEDALKKAGDTPYTQSQYFGNQAGTDAVYLGSNGNARHISQGEYAAGVVDEFLRGPESPLNDKEKGALTRQFVLRLKAEHPEWNFWAALFGGFAGGAAEGAESGAKAAAGSEIDAEALTLSKTVEEHLNDVTKLGTKARPYGDSRLVMKEIMEAGKAVPDPGGVPGGLRWDVPGAVNGSKGSWELVIDPKTSTVLHFVFKSAPKQ